MEKKLEGKKIYNDIIDEAYELEDEEEIIEEKKINNQLVDGEVEVSDDSQNYIPTPPNEEEDVKNSKVLNQPDFNENLSNMKKFYPNQNLDQEKMTQELEQFNLDDETKEIFKYLKEFEPKEIQIETQIKPFIPDFIPAVGEVDAYLKLPKPDQRKEGLGLEKLDE